MGAPYLPKRRLHEAIGYVIRAQKHLALINRMIREALRNDLRLLLTAKAIDMRAAILANDSKKVYSKSDGP